MKEEKILFVCTGNTCRSPMARFLAERLAREAGLPWSFRSAGIAASPGAPLSAGAARALAMRGLPGVKHVSRLVDEALLASCDRVYALAQEHSTALLSRFSAHAGKISMLRENQDIADPVGGTDDDYDRCADLIEDALQLIIRRTTRAENNR